MENGTYLYLMLFENLGGIKYAFFTLAFIFYCAVIILNVLIIFVIFLERTLHKPMYILMSCLSINSLYGTAGFFPRLLTDLLYDTHKISFEACLIQSFVLYTYASFELTILMLMAFDRFVAISKPLHYNNIITKRFLTFLIVIAWLYPITFLSIGGILTARLTICGNKLLKVYCHNYEIVKLSCASITIVNIYGLIMTITTIFIPLGFILYTYVRIIIICQRNTREFRSKAYQICIPHMMILLNYSIAIFCELTLSRFMNGELPIALTVVLSLDFIVIPPFVNPIVYGLNFPDIRKQIRRVIKASK
ncbi:olfactory receptor 52K1-like [Pimephales promelas]|uniref:olfactory receptor 52K1-like n=1 Tax=Pimephales promelas TaxID=90988 RepID=UPI0019556466|nr:olfactory receptor 52K1-like [Pimephales promelas]KAG1932808.1 odorant receptor, family E, subfamily 128 [Pimephales promelas]